MADDTIATADASQADAEATSQVDTQAAEAETAAATETLSAKEARELKNEARNLRARLREAEGKVAAAEAATKTDLEKLTDRAAKAETELVAVRAEAQKATLEVAVIKAASDPKLSARDPGKLLRLIDHEALTFDGGKVIGLDSELQRLKKEWPELFIQVNGNVDAGAGTQAARASDMNAAIRQAAGRA